MASHRKNSRTWYAASVNTTNHCARLPLSMACPTKPSDVSFVLFATLEQDKPLSFPLPVFEDTCVRCDSHAVTLFTTCSYGVCIEPDTFFSHVHTSRLASRAPSLACCSCTVSLCRDVLPMPDRRYRISVAEAGERNTRRTWIEGGKRRQAGTLRGLRRLYTSTPGKINLISYHPGQRLCHHTMTSEPSSSWTAHTSLQ